MNTNKIGIITDTHFGVRGDATWMLDYQEEFYSKQFFPKLKEQGIDTILHLGDLFDRRKYINFVTLRRTREMFLEKLVQHNIHMYIIPGNHDVSFKSTNEVNSLTTLLGEFKSHITVLETPTELQFGNSSFLMIPWINQENEDEVFTAIKNTTSKILCGHLDIIGFDMYKGIKATHGYDRQLFAKFDQVWTGHFHTKSTLDNIFYLGAPMEFTWADSEDPRGFHLFETSNTLNAPQFEENKLTIHKKIWYSDDTKEGRLKVENFDETTIENKLVRVVVGRKTDQKLFEKFLDKVYNTSVIDLTIMEDYSEIQLGLQEDTKEEVLAIKDQSTKNLLLSFIDKLETDLDKQKLKTIATSVYVEAMHQQAGLETE